MVIYEGGMESYLSNKQWINKEKIFDIDSLLDLLKKNYNANNNNKRTVAQENFMYSILSEGLGHTFADVSDRIKNKLSTDTKKILRIQKDIKYIGDLIDLRDEKKNHYEEIQDELIKIRKIASTNLSLNNNSTNNYCIKNPIQYKSYNQEENTGLLMAIMNSVLSKSDIDSLEKKMFGCPDKKNKSISKKIYFSKNTEKYDNCSYLLESLKSTICWKNIDLSKQGIGNIEDISTLMILLVTQKKAFDINSTGITINKEAKKCKIFEMFVPFMKDEHTKDKEIFIQPLHKQYKAISKKMFIKQQGKKVVSEEIRDCSDVYKFLKNIYNRHTEVADKKR